MELTVITSIIERGINVSENISQDKGKKKFLEGSSPKCKGQVDSEFLERKGFQKVSI